MSSGIAGLEKRDQVAVREWLRLQDLAHAVRPPRRLWPLLHLLTFAAGLLAGWLL